MSNFESLVYALHSLSQLQVISISQHCKVRDYDKEILTMILDKVKNIKSGRLLRRIISSNYLTRKAAQYLYRKYYSLWKKREFVSRINKIDPDKYLDVCGQRKWDS